MNGRGWKSRNAWAVFTGDAQRWFVRQASGGQLNLHYRAAYRCLTTSTRPASSQTAAARAAAAAAAAPAVAAVAAPAALAGLPAVHLRPAPVAAAHHCQTAAADPGSRPAPCCLPLCHRLSHRPPLPRSAGEAAAPVLLLRLPSSPAAIQCCLGAGLRARLRYRRCWCRMLPASAGSWGRTTAAAPPPPAALCRSTCAERGQLGEQTSTAGLRTGTGKRWQMQVATSCRAYSGCSHSEQPSHWHLQRQRRRQDGGLKRGSLPQQGGSRASNRPQNFPSRQGRGGRWPLAFLQGAMQCQPGLLAFIRSAIELTWGGRGSPASGTCSTR